MSPGQRSCPTCAFQLGSAGAASVIKCGRCGSERAGGADFCQVCGLRLSSRGERPVTAQLNVRTLVRGGSAQVFPGAAGRLPPAQAAQGIQHDDPTPLSQMMQPGRYAPTTPQPSQRDVITEPEQALPLRKMPAATTPAAPRVASGPPDLRVPNAPTMFQMANKQAAPKVVSNRVPPGAASPAPAPFTPAPVSPVPAPVVQPVPMVRDTPGPARAVAVSGASGAARVVVVRRDGSEGESFVFSNESLTIGRNQGEIRFPPDSFISPAHARIDRKAKGVELHDLSSRNGVYVRILAPQAVYPGDHFLLGHQLVRLDNLEGEELEAAPDANGVRAFGTPLEPAWGKLVLIGVGGVAADVYYLRGTQTVFGRESGDILFPSDAFLSRRHARIRMELRNDAMSVMLEDLGSANGTYLRLRGSAVLGTGDMFRVGDQLFRVQGV